MLKATKVRIYPTPEQAEFLNRQFGAVRFAYNKALHIISSQYKRYGLKSLKVRNWQCPACSVRHDRDINAALNIKAQGILKLKAQDCRSLPTEASVNLVTNQLLPERLEASPVAL